MTDFGVYVRFVDLERCEMTSKSSPTGLMRSVMSMWYSNARLAACSATSGIDPIQLEPLYSVSAFM